MSYSNQKGDIGEAYFVLRATEKGYWAGKMPQDCPYDYALDRGNGLERIQVKYRSTGSKGSFQINSTSSSLSSDRSYKNRVDYFAVFNPESNKVYLIPAAKITDGTATIFRLTSSKNNQTKGINLLEDYKDW